MSCFGCTQLQYDAQLCALVTVFKDVGIVLSGDWPVWRFRAAAARRSFVGAFAAKLSFLGWGKRQI
jgi:hypothetical protein